MSLINQMLHDLEQRRTTGMTASPLGGLGASSSTTPFAGGAINYMLLTATVTAVFASGVMIAYLFGNQQQVTATENSLATTSKYETPDFVENILLKNTETVLSMESRIAEIIVNPKPVVTTAIEPVAKKTRPETENIIEPYPVNIEQPVNKIIRPLTDKQKSRQAFQRAIHMIARDDRQSAQRVLEEALSFSPSHLRARETLAALLLNAGQPGEAASSLREGLQLMPKAAPLAKLYARILADEGDIDTAVEVLEQARPTIAADTEYHAVLAALYQKSGKHAQAAQVYQQILLQRPNVASWWMGLALARDAMGEATTALTAFQRAQRAGGLGGEVLKYVQTRIVALTPSVPMNINHDLDEFEE